MTRRAGAAMMLAMVGGLIAARPVEAQWGVTAVGVGEFDTEDVVLALASLSASPQRSGWSPTLGLSAYWLRFPRSESSNETVIAVTPSVGIKNSFEVGAAALRVGYALQDKEVSGAPVTSVDVGEGVVTTAQVDYWGDGTGFGLQGIVSYNFGSENLWTRGRLTHRLMGFSDGQIRLGGEVAYLTGNSFESLQPGGLVEFHPGRGTVINIGVGTKLNDPGSDATYFRAELVLFPGR